MLDKKQSIFDGHNDVLSRLYSLKKVSQIKSFTEGGGGAVDFPKCITGGFAGGLFAVYVPSKEGLFEDLEAMKESFYELPLPEPVEFADGLRISLEQFSILIRLEREGVLSICKTVDEIYSSIDKGVLAAVIHLEGAEAIDPGLYNLDVFYSLGLRSIGPVWSRNNIFAGGVPFRFPSSADYGPGLTENGIQLVKRCNELGILIDLSHMNTASFWDVAKYSEKPLIATHSNVHVFCPHSRNLSDDQLQAIANSRGLVGVNFGAAFCRDDGRMLGDFSIETILRHIDYLIEKLGESGVAFGSDYDGAVLPDEIASVSNLQRLVKVMRKHGYGDDLIERICLRNWINILDRTWSSKIG